MPKLLPALPLLAPVVVLAGACMVGAPDGGPTVEGGQVGELEGLTLAEAAERVGVGVAFERATFCQGECLEFAVAGCSNIVNQCESDDADGYALAGFRRGPYRLECAAAKRLACGGVADSHACYVDCQGWLGRLLSKL